MNVLPPYHPQSHDQASEEVWSIATYYPEMLRIFVPSKPIKKLKPNMELRKRETKSTPGGSGYEDDPQRSVRKTKRSVLDYALCNRFTNFATFTFAEDRYNDDRNRRRMNDWLKNQKKKMKKFGYLIVPERHEDGALHFHGMIKHYEGELKRSVNQKTHKPLFDKKHRPVFEYPGYRSGFTVVKMIDQTPEALSKAANYLVKYITKEMPRISGQNRYWASKGLNKPYTVNNPPEHILNQKPTFKAQSIYGTTYIFPYRDGVNHYEVLHELMTDMDELLDES